MVGIVNKPDINYGIWASNGDVAVPSSEKVEIGHIVEKPKKEIVNWIENRQDQFMAYLNHVGISEWDSKTTYKANVSFVNRSGTVYKAKSQNIDKDPTLNQDIWEISWATYSDFYNLSNRVDKIENEEGYLDLYVSKANPVFTVETKGVGYNNITNSSGFSFDTSTPVVINNDTIVARFSDQMTTEDASKSVATTEWVQELLSKLGDMFAPTGSVVAMATRVVPQGYLECNGNTVSRSEFSKLFSVIGTSFGSGDGSTTFNLPDLRGQFVRGFDSGSGVDANRVFGTLQGDAIRNISASAFYGYDADVATKAPSSYTSGAFKYSDISLPDNTNKLSVIPSTSALNWYPLIFDASLQVPTANENRPKNIALTYMIKT